MTEDRGAFKTKYPVLLPDTTPSTICFWAVSAVHLGTAARVSKMNGTLAACPKAAAAE
jgi:hypothetical protein